MNIDFFKYQGTGNDFVIVDNRDLHFPKETEIIKRLCDRRFGIGGDGLILLENEEQADFKMVYYNADGRESTMCGNGGRCIVAFAHFLDLFEEKTTFLAVDGMHEAEIHNGLIKLRMIDVPKIMTEGDSFVLNTGSPHFVAFQNNLDNFDVYTHGNKIRNSATYRQEGINVNFVEQTAPGEIFVRTYERGVEDETYSCGTGATAAALVLLKNSSLDEVTVKVLGGKLGVKARKQGEGFTDIWLQGRAEQVFKGKIQI